MKKKIIIILFSIILFFACAAVIIIKSNDIDKNYIGAACFSGNDAIYAYKDEKIKKIINTSSPGVIKNSEDENIILWISEENCINIYNLKNSALDVIKTNYNIYDCKYIKGYIVYSGLENDTGVYGICLKKLDTGEEAVVSNTQNCQVNFALYNDDIYFFEPNEFNHLYKYNILEKEKSLVSSLVENRSSVRPDLYVCQQGIFFTKAVFNDAGDEKDYLYRLQDEKIVQISDEVDSIVGLQNNNLYIERMNNIYKINLESGEKTQLIKNQDVAHFNMQNQYIIYELFDLSKEKEVLYIYDINAEQLVYTKEFM